MKTADKLNLMISYLQEKITSGEFACGDRLPAIRKLTEQFDITYGTAMRGINRICEMGLVEKVPGSGIYVKERPDNIEGKNYKYRLATILTGVDRWESPGIYSTVFLGLQKTAEKNDCSLSINYIPMDVFSNEALEEAAGDADAVILLSEYDMAVKEIKFRAPVTGVCMHSLESSISYIDIDPYCVARNAMKYFASKNVDVVEIYANAAPAYQARAMAFAMEWQFAGKKFIMKPPARPVVTDKLNDFNPKHGHFFTTGALYQLYSEMYQNQTGGELHEDHAVLSVDGKNRIDPHLKRGASIAIDWQIIGKYAVEESLYRITNPGASPKKIYIQGKLYA
jgi:DNA-binding transcriptional regulator YhcF (GntR family)